MIVGMREAEACKASSPVKQVAVPAKMPSKDSVQSLIDTVAALLVFNCFSPEDGYDVFDADDDGKVSPLHKFYDVETEGFVDKGLWTRGCSDGQRQHRGYCQGTRSDDFGCSAE